MIQELTQNELYAPLTTYDGLFPVRQLFVKKHGKMPHVFFSNYSVWVEKFIIDNKNYLILKQSYYKSQDDKNEEIYQCILYDFGDFFVIIQDTFISNSGKLKGVMLIYYKQDNKKINEIKKYISQNRVEEEEEGLISLICRSNQGFYLKQYYIKKTDIDFSANYNEDFKEIDEIILKRLNTNNDKGLVLLHGEPGTGKTTYIRRIIHKIKNKRILYMPPDMASELSSPDLIPFLTDLSNSILIVEDAENVLMKRQGQHNQAISNILNLSDGILGDCLNIQIVSTFNTDLKNIDDALLRKGRLIARYKFDALTEDRVRKLSATLGVEFNKDFKILADIYNSREKKFFKEKKQIGLVNKM